MHPHTRPLAALVAISCLLPAVAFANSFGPPDGKTGAPGEGLCTECHVGFPPNSGLGMLEVTGIPEPYVPGETYTVTVALSDPDAARWGFELTVLESGGTSTGVLAPRDAQTQTSALGNRSYIKHTSAGTFPGQTGSASWLMDWTAPAAGAGQVTIYVAGNGANNNLSSSGDRIYNTDFVFTEQDLTPVWGEAPVAVRLLGNQPNPFNPRTEIRFALPAAVRVQLGIYSLDGRLVRNLVDEERAAGEHAVDWDGTDHGGRPQPSGTYLYVLRTGSFQESGRMTLVR